jgi:hypothetical protein
MSSSNGDDTAAHHRHARLRHHRADVRKVDVDQAGTGDQVSDALDGTLQHLVGRPERIEQRGLRTEHRQQLLIRDGDQRIAELAQLGNPMIRHEQALVALHLEGLRDHGHRQNAKLLRHLRDDRCCPGARATAHAGGDEQHVATLDELDDAIAVLPRRLAPDLRIGACAQPLGDVASDLQGRLDLGVLQRLRVGVDAHEFHAVDSRRDHVSYGVPAAAAHADHFDDGALAVRVHQFKHSELLLYPGCRRLSALAVRLQKLPWNQERMRSKTVLAFPPRDRPRLAGITLSRA